MGTNFAPILANTYGIVRSRIQKNIKWPEMFKRFIDDGFGGIQTTKRNFHYGHMNLIAFLKIYKQINGILEHGCFYWLEISKRKKFNKNVK